MYESKLRRTTAPEQKNEHHKIAFCRSFDVPIKQPHWAIRLAPASSHFLLFIRILPLRCTLFRLHCLLKHFKNVSLLQQRKNKLLTQDCKWQIETARKEARRQAKRHLISQDGNFRKAYIFSPHFLYPSTETKINHPTSQHRIEEIQKRILVIFSSRQWLAG